MQLRGLGDAVGTVTQPTGTLATGSVVEFPAGTTFEVRLAQVGGSSLWARGERIQTSARAVLESGDIVINPASPTTYRWYTWDDRPTFRFEDRVEAIKPSTGGELTIVPTDDVFLDPNTQPFSVVTAAPGSDLPTYIEPPVLPSAGDPCTHDPSGRPGHLVVSGNELYCEPDPNPGKWYMDRRLWIAVGVATGAGLLYGGYRWYKGRRK
jgi:hypothetical protein